LQISTTGYEETEVLGRKIGSKLRGSEVIELVSDLGGGKTTLVRGIAAGLGSLDRVSSPTFTVSKEYTTKDIRLVHYDFYRLSDPGIMSHEIAEALEDKKAVVVVEWAEIVQDILPADRIVIKMKVVGDTDDARRLDICYPDSLKYVFTDL
jgi:tRNA threonylcarbamoyladenosine biosynthesis protein TsaE